jgi:hypothetical protein
MVELELTRFKGGEWKRPVTSPEAMIDTITALGIVPFFINCLPGYSIEELTPKECWFDDDSDTMGPWDWKIHCLQSGRIAYGKFLLGGKAAFATVEWYRELMNWRRSRKELSPKGLEKDVYEAILEAGTLTMSELRKRFGVKKSKMDTIVTHLEYATLVVIGDIQRVYRGPDLHYDGWQRASVCTPEALFSLNETADDSEDFGEIFFKKKNSDAKMSLKVRSKPETSYKKICEHIHKIMPNADEAQLRKIVY